MTDDQFWRILIGGGIMGLLTAFWPQIMAWLRRHGYKDWREK